MPLKLYDTLTRSERSFEPLDPTDVRMYVCGPTVYSYAHIGNARPVVVFDTLFRLLRHSYGIGHVTYVRNITDIDDKIIEASRQTGEPIEAITARTAKTYQDDMAALGALDPTHQPRATEYVASMIRIIETLIGRGHAYAAEGHVLFHVPSMPDYGRLSRHPRDELVAGARIEVAPYKRDPADFVLWKPSTPDQPGWDSPWGRGRPGWHIECSAMGEDLLGEVFDIHGGGQDLIFPHHENEIAQSACAHAGEPHARFWMHNGFLTVDQEKMSKSIGNVVTVHALLEQGWPGEAIRLVLLSAHYRQPVDFSEENLRQAKATLDRWYLALNEAGGPSPEVAAPDSVVAALESDLNTPLAIAALHELASDLNKALGDARDEARARFQGGAHLLGLLHQDPEVWLKAGTSDADETRIEHLVAARIAAKKARNFAEADRIRAELAAEGVVLEDTAQGTRWRRS